MKATHKISAVWAVDKIYFINKTTDSRYIIEGVPNDLSSGDVFTVGEIQFRYLKSFEYNGESIELGCLFFNIEDLKSKKIIQQKQPLSRQAQGYSFDLVF